jgi:hypothetical protein
MAKMLYSLPAIALLICGCSDSMRDRFTPFPDALGSANDIAVIADQELWEGPVGDTLRYYFESAYLLLPQPEPIFNLRHFTPLELRVEPVRKELRTYLMIGHLEDSLGASALIRSHLSLSRQGDHFRERDYHTRIGRDKWARGQLIVYLYGRDQSALMRAIPDRFPAIASRINDFDRSQIDANTYLQGVNEEIQSLLVDKYGFRLKVPGDYLVAIDAEDATWIRKDTENLISNLIFHKLPYTEPEQLSKSGLKAIRNELGQQYISSSEPGTYMVINDEDLPLLIFNKTVDDQFALEARGIWELENAFMGGPFISYLIHNPATQSLIFIDGFVHAPGVPKRDLMQQLEHVISSFEFVQADG